jgi:hypothetical protein
MKPKPKPDPKEAPVAAPSSADYHPPQRPAATPIGVSRVGQTHVVLNSGQVISRGEVRNLKDYERRLDQKTIAMHKLAELAKSLQAHAHDQNKEVTTLLEQARTKSPGDAVIGHLTKLQERTALQAHQAAELLKRAIRAAESTTVLLANVTTRYGGIYKAVCDSPLEIPGELDFYDDRTATSV